LWAEKNEPHGARFIFTLPVAAKNDAMTTDGLDKMTAPIDLC
jgi:hypothetical protein